MLPLIISGICLLVLLSCTLLFVAWRQMVWMPGRSFRGVVPPLSDKESQLREELKHELTVLAEDIGERNISQCYEQMVSAAKFIEGSLRSAGYDVCRQEIIAGEKPVWNVIAERPGSQQPDEVLVVGAHYDTVPGSPGANDNGSAVVANLALARAFTHIEPARTVRFVFFVNEESPYYMTQEMGSLRYAEQCRASGENVVGMLALETIGCYLQEARSQRFPVAALSYLYPTVGNFVAVVGNVRSRRLVHQVIRGLRRVPFPSQGMAAPHLLKDIFRSDHAAFWHCGYPALMVTDTANFRYPYYHTAEDTVDKINFTALARVVTGLRESVLEVCQGT